MKQVVSKVRTKKTKRRQKKADGATSVKTPLRENPVVGLAIAFLAWAFAVFTLGAEGFFQHRSDPAFLMPLAGDAAFLLIGLFAVGAFLEIVQCGIVRQNSKILLLALVSIAALLPAKVLMYLLVPTGVMPLEIAQFLAPLAVAPLLGTILLGGAVGVAVGVWTSLVIAILAGRSLPLLIAGMVATVVTARIASKARTRSKVIRTGLVIGLSEIACVFGLTALNWQRPDVIPVLHQAGGCLVSGFLSAMLVLLILPLFEAGFGITSDITLLELSDLGHPLLQRLALEAPGTYHHSLIVASLAQAAADEIGANSLLARVASYYHDVGKLTKPDFFAENLQMKNNPHDTLAPSMSTLVITAHVKEGLSLALLHKLPPVISEIIQEHHGTSLLSYFHHKAKTQVNSETIGPNPSPSNGQPKVPEGDFRYEGPRPSSRESAIICLADASEAASRTATKVTPGHLETLVKEIVDARLRDGQLDQSGLSVTELAKIKRSFVFTLTNMMHGRVPYPKDEDRGGEQSNGATAPRRENKGADKLPDEASRADRPGQDMA